MAAKISCCRARAICSPLPNQRLTAGDIDEGFVQRQAFYQRRIARKQRKDLGANARIMRVTRRHHGGLRAAPQGLRHGHGVVHPVHPRLVGRRAHHAAVHAAAHHHRFAAQRRLVAHLHSRKEGIHVHMDNLARQHAVLLAHGGAL